MESPCVTIGDITANNDAQLIKAGADFLAVEGAVWNHGGATTARFEAMYELMADASR